MVSRAPIKCECCDRSCPAHEGVSSCASNAKLLLVRMDMDDPSGTPMCHACAADALDSGVFAVKPGRRVS